MSGRALAVHKAVFEALTAALAPVAVYDHVPENASMPFVDISSHQVLPNPSFRPLNIEPVAEHQVFLTVWSSYRGQKQVLDILSKIRTALDHVDLTLESVDLTLESDSAVLCHVLSQECRLDADGATYQGAAVIRVVAI